MIVEYYQPWLKKKVEGIYNGTLTLTNGITVGTTPKCYTMNYYSWKEGMNFNTFLGEEKNSITIEK